MNPLGPQPLDDPSSGEKAPAPAKTNRKTLLWIAAILGISLILVAVAPLLTPLAHPPEGPPVIVNMTTRSWRFDPNVVQGHAGVEASSRATNEVFADTVIKVRKGDSVVINIVNTEPNQPHGFALEEFGVRGVVIPPEQDVTVRFVANEEGMFTFFCTVFCGTGHPFHRGTFVVSGA